MTGFALFRWDGRDAQVGRTVTAVQSAILPSWIEHGSGPGWLMLGPGTISIMPGISDDGRPRFVIGQIFDRSATNIGSAARGRPSLNATPFAALAARLAKDHWGAFAAVEIHPQDPFALRIFRDPIGALDCVAWRSGDMIVVTSCPERLLAALPPNNFAIDWPRVAGLIHSAGAALEYLPFKGLIDIQAGAITRITEQDHDHHQIWSPTQFIEQTAASRPQPLLELPALVDACVGAWAQDSKSAVAELSGGLDSAIVAASLTRLPINPVAGWLHYHPADPEGDERDFARAVAGHLHVPLTEIALAPPRLDKALVESVPVRMRPILSGVSLSHHHDLTARAAALGADSLFTGQGGDALFFQTPSPTIAADLWRCGQPMGRRLRAIEDLAAWTRRPIGAILASALTAPLKTRRPGPPAPFVNLLSSRLEQDVGSLAWLSDLQGIPAAKVVQITGLALARCVFGASSGIEGLNVLHPLLSQPLIERCLAISAFDLTEGRRDRALIRRAYRDRLPATLLDRHGKGDMAAFYGRTLAAAVPFLRGYLLNGALAAYSVINTDRLSALLDPDEIMVREVSVELFTLLFMERWARHWLAVGVFSAD